MNQAEFDKFADEYRELHRRVVGPSGEEPEFFAEYKVRDVLASLGARAHNHPLRVLDFGAGTGTSISHFRKHLPAAQLTCLDVSASSLAIGAELFPGAADFVRFDGQHIPYTDGEFDVAFAACVFHHIDAGEHVRLLRELQRVLRVGGVLFVFEHNPLNPITVNAVRNCAFDANAVLIRAGTMVERLERAGFSEIELRYRLFVPGSLRALRPLERFLTWLPLGAQYYAAGYKRDHA